MLKRIRGSIRFTKYATPSFPFLVSFCIPLSLNSLNSVKKKTGDKPSKLVIQMRR